MACYSPLEAYRSKEVNPSGKRSLVFNIRYALDDGIVKVPCGRCIGCRLEYSRQWAVRCVHEAQMFDENCFITLTYDNDHLPLVNGVPTLVKKDFQDFMKRFRKHYHGFKEISYVNGNGDLVTNSPIRYYHCGEYGETFGRPHYHASIFNFDFYDKEQIGVSNGFPLYTSKLLQELWPFGHVTVAPFSFQTAAYVARYMMKKAKGKSADSAYAIVDVDTGEVIGKRQPEYCTMSRSPGIGRLWYDEFKSDVYPSDQVIINGRAMKPPRFYDNLMAIDDAVSFEEIQFDRYKKSLNFIDNSTSERLAVREACKQASINKLIRRLD